jgi:hypothetical protein
MLRNTIPSVVIFLLFFLCNFYVANKQTNELRIKKYTHVAEMNIFIDNTL